MMRSSRRNSVSKGKITGPSASNSRLYPRLAFKNAAELDLVIHGTAKDACRTVSHTGFARTIGPDKVAPDILLRAAFDDFF